MIVRSIRRVTNDARHNAFTGCCWFKGNLYVAYRQGDAHVCEFGRIVVLRSRDGGLSWDHVAVLRGPDDTRDAHLYSDGKRLYAVGFVYEKKGKPDCYSGCSYTNDGDLWTPWRRYAGTGRAVMWRPQFFRGIHYCAGYVFDLKPSRQKKREAVNWYESRDGLGWKPVRTLHSGSDEPNECSLEIRPDGRATMLMRCESRGRNPYLCTSRYPFRKWKMQKLRDVSIGGPCVWTVGDQVYLGARWRLLEQDHHTAHTAIFKVVKGKTKLQCVLPSGPGFDHSYMALARYPDNDCRFVASFYSDAVAPSDLRVGQWDHPDIYLADLLFEAEYLRDGFFVSKRITIPSGLKDAPCPDPRDASLQFTRAKAGVAGYPDFLNVTNATEKKPGIIYIVRDIEIVGADRVRVHVGYDGPVKVWWNGQEVFQGSGTNPAMKDQTTLVAKARDGTNRLVIALDTNGGKAEGIFARWERVAAR